MHGFEAGIGKEHLETRKKAHGAETNSKMKGRVVGDTVTAAKKGQVLEGHRGRGKLNTEQCNN